MLKARAANIYIKTTLTLSVLLLSALCFLSVSVEQLLYVVSDVVMSLQPDQAIWYGGGWTWDWGRQLDLIRT